MGSTGLAKDYQKHETTVKKISNSRINPDSKKTLWFTVLLIVSLGLTSFLVSFNGLLDVAAWVGLPHNLRWAVPIFIDISILAYSMAAVIHKARNEPVRLTWLSLAAFTLISVVANAAHSLSVGEGHTGAQQWIGAAIAAAAPIAVFAATEELSRLAFRSPEADYVEAVEVEDTAEEVAPLAMEPAPVLEEKVLAEPAPEPVQQEVKAPVFESAPVAKEPAVEPGEQEPVAPEFFSVPEIAPEPEPVTEVVSVAEVDVEEELVVWVKQKVAAGENVTGAMVGDFLGKSSRTGANRLKTLKEQLPHIFNEGATS